MGCVCIAWIDLASISVYVPIVVSFSLVLFAMRLCRSEVLNMRLGFSTLIGVLLQD